MQYKRAFSFLKKKSFFHLLFTFPWKYVFLFSDFSQGEKRHVCKFICFNSLSFIRWYLFIPLSAFNSQIKHSVFPFLGFCHHFSAVLDNKICQPGPKLSLYSLSLVFSPLTICLSYAAWDSGTEYSSCTCIGWSQLDSLQQ